MFAQGLGELMPDQISIMLGTGYFRFEAQGIHGLVKVDNCRLDILAVSATQPGTGQFRRFMDNMKNLYTQIYVWEVWNDNLAAALGRYGFEPITEAHDGEQLDGFLWSDNSNANTPQRDTAAGLGGEQ